MDLSELADKVLNPYVLLSCVFSDLLGLLSRFYRPPISVIHLSVSDIYRIPSKSLHVTTANTLQRPDAGKASVGYRKMFGSYVWNHLEDPDASSTSKVASQSSQPRVRSKAYRRLSLGT